MNATKKNWLCAAGVVLLALFCLGAGTFQALADNAGDSGKPFLHELFTDNMVLQRGKRIQIWGWTRPGAKVRVRFDGKRATATAGADGEWRARIGPFKAGGPYTMTVSGPETVVLKNVLVGDVWICSGQSNMEFGIANGKNAAEEIAHANYPKIRLYTVPMRIAASPRKTLKGQWLVCTPKTIAKGAWGGFTAVGYFFGRDLYRKLKVPIGLIHSSWGGTVAEAWTSARALRRMKDFRPALKSLAETRRAMAKGHDSFAELMGKWYQRNDPGSASGLGWAAPGLGDSDWETMKLPRYWEKAGLPDFDGVVWFRKEIQLPEAWASKRAVLHLGRIDDRDTTWFNGEKIGGKDQWLDSRDYPVPAGDVKAGTNVIAVRVLDTGGNGGLYGPARDMKLTSKGKPAPEAISLAGTWRYKVGVSLAKAGPVPRPLGSDPNVVTVLFNGMIAPLVPYGIKGAIWYQGESNVGRARQYRRLLPLMIRDWRRHFHQGKFPFLIVQLANFLARKPEPGESAWAELRDAQLQTAEHVKNAGLAVTIDIGNAKDIHPKDKQDVGYRLALAALAIAYHQHIEYSGPIYRGMKKEGQSIRLSFAHVDGGLMAKGGKPLLGFAIAGPDGKFVWADAEVQGKTVVVSSPKVQNPMTVRYAWADNPLCNLYNEVGLPASPFQTDEDQSARK